MPTDIRYAKNLLWIQQTRDASQLATRVYSRGAPQDGTYPTMADAIWPVTAINGAVVKLGPDATGEPIFYPRQLDHLFARKWGTLAHWKVLATNEPAQEVTLEDVPDGLAVGNYLNFRRGGVCLPPGVALLYLDHPDAHDQEDSPKRPWARVIDRPDVPPVDNLVPNAFLEQWSGGVPVGWEVVSSIVTQSEDDRFSRFGRRAAKVFCSGAGAHWPAAGIRTAWIPVQPRAERPHFTAQVALHVTLGRVRIEVEVDYDGTGGTGAFGSTIVIPDPGLPVSFEPNPGPTVRANVVRQNNQALHFGVGGLNLWDDPKIGAAKRVRIWVVREKSDETTEFYIDAAQLTNTATGAPTIYDRRGSNTLWHAAIWELAGFSLPLYDYDYQPLDRYRAEPAQYRHEMLVEGMTLPVHDAEQEIHHDTRVEQIEQDPRSTHARVSRVRVTTRPKDLTRLIERRPVPRSINVARDFIGDPSAPAGSPGGGLSGFRVTRLINPDLDGQDYELVEWDHNDPVQADGGATYSLVISSTVGGALATRNPTHEYDGANSLSRIGSYRAPITIGSPATHPYRVNVYKGLLQQGGTTIQTHEATPAEGGAHYVPNDPGGPLGSQAFGAHKFGG